MSILPRLRCSAVNTALAVALYRLITTITVGFSSHLMTESSQGLKRFVPVTGFELHGSPVGHRPTHRVARALVANAWRIAGSLDVHIKVDDVV